MAEEKTQNCENIVSKEDLFDENGKFKAGHPKIGGKEKGSRSFTTKVRLALLKIADGENYTNEEAFIKSILKKGIIDGDSAIIRLIWNYLDGMPLQKNELTGKDGEPLTIKWQQNEGDNNTIQTEEMGEPITSDE